MAAGYATGAGAQVMFASAASSWYADDEEQEEIKASKLKLRAAQPAANATRQCVCLFECSLAKCRCFARSRQTSLHVRRVAADDPSPMGAIMGAVNRDDPEELAAILSDNLFSKPHIRDLPRCIRTIDDALADSASQARPRLPNRC